MIPGQFGAAWARRFCERFFADPGPAEMMEVRLYLLADILAYKDQRLTIARLAYIMLELNRNWTPAHIDHMASFIHAQSLRMTRENRAAIRGRKYR